MTSTNLSSNKRIAKNTALLYVRKVLSILIGIYASRLLLKTLGIDDYGLYGVTGSVVIMFAALRALFTDSIQRYINIEKGMGEENRVSLIFTYGVLLNGGICLAFLLCTEIVGYVIFPKLNIPPADISTAYWILQFSILSAIVTMMTIPYDAVMIANERFNAYAYFTILNSLLILVGICLLVYLPGPKVVTYAAITFIVALIVRILSSVYCKRHFRTEVTITWKWDKPLFKQMTFFSGWNALGNGGYSLFDEGINFLLNVFGGLGVNGARSVAIQVRQNLTHFNLEVLSAFKPQTMGAYAQNDKTRFRYLIETCSKFSFSISAILCFAIFVYTPFVLKLWLGEIPEYSVMFVRIIMIYLMVRGIHNSMDLIFKTTAKIKQYQIWELSVSILSLPVAWFVLKLGTPYYCVFWVAVLAELVKYLGDFYILKRVVGYDIRRFMVAVVSRCVYCGILLIGIGYAWIKLIPEDTWYYNILGMIVALIMATMSCYLVVLNSAERHAIKALIVKQ